MKDNQTPSLFDEPEAVHDTQLYVPLADRMRPQTLEEVVGQEKLVEEGRFLREAIRRDQIPSMIFWGPPGVGKTTLAHLIAHHTGSEFEALSAVLAGVKDVKRIVEAARQQRRVGRQTILFVDEIHRFNKAQQDAFLPHVEHGTITLIGATTENPSFEVIGPLLSRCRVLVLEPLSRENLLDVLKRALHDGDRGLGDIDLAYDEKALEAMAEFASGDARKALNALEAAARLAQALSTHDKPRLTVEVVEEALQQKTLLYDKAGEEHFNLISAFHKSLRNSDADASLYWMGRMLEAGEDPLYIARRMVRFASEDIGLADPSALQQAVAAWQAVEFVGLPEGKLALAQAAVYLALAPKSNSLYTGYARVQEAVRETLNEPVPLYLRQAPTPLMKKLGYGKGYRYAHNQPEGVADMECLPKKLAGSRFFEPGKHGFEKEIAQRLWKIAQKKKSSGG